MKFLNHSLLLSFVLSLNVNATQSFPINTSNGSNAWKGSVYSNGALPLKTEALQPMTGEPAMLRSAPANSNVKVAGTVTVLAASQATSQSENSFAPDFDAYSQDVQNIVRACDGDIYRIYDLIRNHVEFQPYFGFRKSPEVTWQSRRGNDADQAFLLVECLRAAGFDADFQYGIVILPDTEALAWFGVDNIAGLNTVTGSAGYFGGPLDGFYGIEQIWCSVVVEGTRYSLTPAYKTYKSIPGIDLATAMNYSQVDLLDAASGVETATYAQNVSELGVDDYLKARAMALVAELQANHPTAAMNEIISGRRIVETNLAADFSNGFYTPEAFVSSAFDNFLFDDPYGDYTINDSSYSFYAFMTLAVGEVNGAGDSFVAPPTLITGGPTGFFTGRKLAVTFDEQNRAELRVDDVIVDSETATPGSNPIGWGYIIQHPYDRSARTLYDEIRVRGIDRGSLYVYAFDTGGAGEPAFSNRRRQILEAYQRDGLETTDPEVATEALYLLGLNWARQNDLSVQMLAEQREFVPVLHHIMALVKQEESFSVDIPATITGAPRDGNTIDPGRNIRAILTMGSAMEHGVIKQNYPDFDAVSTVRYVRENNLAGGKTFLATASNYSTIATDPDFIAGWNSGFRNSLFPSELNSGFDLIIPENGAIQLDSLTGNGYFRYNTSQTSAVINPGNLKGGFATTPGFIDFENNPFPLDPTFGPDNLESPLSFDPIDMLTGAYVYDGTDLSLSGDGVRGLTFSRHYSSLASAKNTSLGKGWSHNHQSSIVEHTDIDAAFGQATPVHAASLIAATWAVSDMVDLPDSPKAWVVGSLSAYWGMEAARGNTATIAMGRRTLPFTRLADGSFLPPPGMTGVLAQDANTGKYSLEERFDLVADFNADNRLESITDADGKQRIYSYFASGENQGRLQTVTDHYGRTLTFTYANDLLTQVSDSTGRDVDFTYTDELLTGVTDPEGHTAGYTYDAEDRIQSVFNKKGEKVAENTYDDFGQVCLQVAEDDAAQEWEYAFTGTLNVEINPDDEFLSYTFDDKGRQIAVTNGAGDQTAMAYDGQNQLVRTMDPRGNITRFEYDARNNLRFTYDARNGASGTTYKVERQYDAEDHLVKLIDEAGNKTTYDYDAEHHLIKVTDPLLRETSYTYVSSGPHDGLLETMTTPGATGGQTHVTTNAYDTNGYPNSITRPDASVITRSFNARGDLLFAEVTTAGETSTYPVTNTYDLNRRLLTTEDGFGFGATIVYDTVGNVISTTDRFGNESRSTWSPMARLETTTGSDGQTTTFAFDDSGRQSQITNPLNQISTLTYDPAGRLETTTNPLNESVVRSYDAAGNRTGLTNARSKLYQFTFNANNLLESLTTPLNRVFNYTYDDRLLPKTVEEPSGQTVTYNYYADGLPKQTVDPASAIDFAYDAKGRLATVTEGPQTITRAYDPLDRVTSFTDSQGNTIGYTYDGGDNLTRLTYPGDKGDVDYEYDAAGRLIKVTDWAGRETEFFYDINSRLAEIRLPNGVRREYVYDSAGRIERQTDVHRATGAVLLDQQYQYDALGRIVKESISPEPPTYTISPAVMTYDDDDRITSWQSGAADITPIFDLDGNMTTGVLNGQAATFVYDSRNRLTQAGTTTYTYDAEDRRIRKTESGATTTYVHDPNAPLSRLLQKTTSNATTYYVYAAGQLLYEEVGGQITAYHFDSRGSTRALSDSSGFVINRITYGTYGEIVSTTTSPTTPFLYNGAYGVQTDNNGLLHMRARYYSTELRRFINADPIGFAGGMNWYAYANGNPMIYTDPLGKFGILGGFGGAVLGGLTGGIIAAVTGGDISAAVAGGIVSGAIIGSGAAIVGAAYTATSSAVAAIATGSVIGAGANIIGDATSQVIENYNDGLSIRDSFMSIDRGRLATAGATGAAFGAIGGASNVLSVQVRSSTRAVQSTLRNNLVSFSDDLNRQVAPLFTIRSVNNSIVNGINRAGVNSATSISLIGTGVEVIGIGTAIGTNQLQNSFFGSSFNGLK